jgi:transcription termination factor NusB
MEFDIHRENTFLGARNNLISFIYKQKLLRKIANIFFNKLLVRNIKKVLFNKKKKPKLKIEFMLQLYSYFKEDINQLEELLKKDLSHWKVK